MREREKVLVETPDLTGIACWVGVVVTGIYLLGEFVGRFL
jgi:hypothetical protein